jgi:hypothetical protein
MQHKDKPKLLKFAHLFKNATIIDEILKFLKKTEIVIRNWLQNQSKTEEKGIDEEIEKGVGIWTYGELPCRQGLGPTGGSHATRGCGLLVAARSLWKHMDGGRLR